MAAQKKRNPGKIERTSDGQRTIGPARWAIAAACIGVAACALAAYPLVDTSSRNRVQALLDSAARLPDRDHAANAAKAESLILRDLAWSPGGASSWARLAYARALEDRGLTPRASQTLLTSYQLSPYDTDLLMWRTAFVFNNWSKAPAPLRDAAFEEVSAFGRFNDHRGALTKLAPHITDPSGQFALMLAAVSGPGRQAEQ